MGNGHCKIEAGARGGNQYICLMQWRIWTSKSILLTGAVEANIIRKKGNWRERLGWTLKAFLVYPYCTNN